MSFLAAHVSRYIKSSFNIAPVNALLVPQTINYEVNISVLVIWNLTYTSLLILSKQGVESGSTSVSNGWQKLVLELHCGYISFRTIELVDQSLSFVSFQRAREASQPPKKIMISSR